MTMAARIATGTHAPCGPGLHTHPLPCEGCGRRVCSPDDLIRTTTRSYAVCSDCYPALRTGWARGGRS